MKVIIRGTRGSTPVASVETQRYGGNTTCIEVLTDAGERIIIDAGSGIRTLGQELAAAGQSTVAMCFTHAHWDHLLGFPMFAPIFSAANRINIHAPKNIGRNGIRNVLGGIMDQRYFPVPFDSLASKLTISEFMPGDSFQIGTALVETCQTRHPGGNIAYRITADGWTFLFSGDHECCRDEESTPECVALDTLLQGSHVALLDAQYTDEEYATRRGWGHSTYTDWPERAARAGVHSLLLTHHDPARSDETLDMMQNKLREQFRHLPVRISMAAEGMEISGPDILKEIHDKTPSVEISDPALLTWLQEFARELNRYNDVSMILDRILSEARQITNADAGTVFLVKKNHLVFANIHNDTLFPGSAANKHAYATTVLPIDNTSITGYAALTNSAVNVADMRKLPPHVPYSFNDSLDLKTGYRTVSSFTIPIQGRDNNVVGVLQLINSMSNGIPVPFTPAMAVRVQLLASHASTAIERGTMARRLILRMLNMASLRDPHETGGHVQRVGSYAAEIYHCWAEKNGTDIDELRHVKSQLRLAAMLHDVGKVGIPDAILKKPGKLDAQEFGIMQTHCILGQKLFDEGDWDVDQMARDVALHHHQRWDGKGYTGTDGTPLAGQDIPLVARITAVADVYDALCSPRCYKNAWSREDAIRTVQESSGSHFDPEIVECFMDVFETIEAIRSRYPDSHQD